MKTKLKELFALIKATFAKFNEDKAPQLAAALSFFTLFSITPLLIVMIAIAGLAFGHQAAQNEIVDKIQGVVGKDAAVMIQTMIENANKPTTGIVATIIAVLTLVLGAAGAFGQIKATLNQIWHAPPRPSQGFVKDILRAISGEFIAFLMVLGTGFLLLASLVLSTVLSAINNYTGSYTAAAAPFWELVHFFVSIGLSTLLFAIVYKILPNAKIAWRDVWTGAAITAALFALGKFLIGLYLGHSGVSSTYGAAGALVVLLLWINYSAQIFFLGAEFTYVYAHLRGSRAPASVTAPESAAKMAVVAAGKLPSQKKSVDKSVRKPEESRRLSGY